MNSLEQRYIDKGNGTVTDRRTGLLWLRNAGCSQALTWRDAQSAAAGLKSGLCGLSDGSRAGDWRVPSIDELIGQLDFHRLPALAPGAPFEGLVTQTLYWSGTAAAQGTTSLAWAVAFNTGNIYNDFQTSRYRVWPVRGPAAPPTSPRFTDHKNGSVTDNRTGLVWLKNANAFSLLKWSDAMSAVSRLASGQYGLNDGSRAGDWRLPGIKELLSLLDYRYIGPTVSNAAGTGPATQGDPFDNLAQNNLYWASAYVGDNKAAWVVLFSGGNMSTTMKEGFYFVWPVRSGR